MVDNFDSQARLSRAEFWALLLPIPIGLSAMIWRCLELNLAQSENVILVFVMPLIFLILSQHYYQIIVSNSTSVRLDGSIITIAGPTGAWKTETSRTGIIERRQRLLFWMVPSFTNYVVFIEFDKMCVPTRNLRRDGRRLNQLLRGRSVTTL